jgi:hypothetical protein
MHGTRVLRRMTRMAMATPIWHETGTTATTMGLPRPRDPSDQPQNGGAYRNERGL